MIKPSDRIKIIVGYLHINLKEFSERTGYDRPQALYDVVNEKTQNISSSMCRKILAAYPEFNKEWIMTGEGPMLVPGTCESLATASSNRQPVASFEVTDSPTFIRYWKYIDALSLATRSFDETLGDYVPMTIPDFSDCTDAIDIYGDAMSPLYKSGSIVLLKQWKENFIEYGQVYLLVTRNGTRLLKQIQPGHDHAHVTCVSMNSQYSPFQILREDILCLYAVKGGIARQSL